MQHALAVIVSVSVLRLHECMRRSNHRGGRPHKGNRDAMMIRPARELGDIVRQAAEDADMTITDFVANILACELNRPDLSPTVVKNSTNQKELPLAKSA